jgi:hypothetical protein
MATQVQFRRGTTAETATFTGAVGEVTVDTSKDTLVVHDNVTPGGFPLLKQDFSNGALASGSSSSAALRFANSVNTGIYSPSAGTFAIVSSGYTALNADTGGNLSTSYSFTSLGRVTGAAFAPTGSSVPTNGLYLSATDSVSLATAGASRFTINAAGDVSITGALTVGTTLTTTGSFSATSFIPTGSTVPANGMYLSAANTVSIATNSAVKLTVASTGNLTATGSINGTAFIPTSNSIPTNGMYLSAGNTISFATNTGLRLSIGPTGTATFAGSVVVPSGSAVAPSISFVASTSTGLFAPALNKLSLATNGVERLQIDDSGYIGIGGLTPSASIALNAGGPIRGFQSSIEIRLQPDFTGAGAVGTFSNHVLLFVTNSTEKMRITATGRVGINTNAPNSQLEVNGDIFASYYNVSTVGTAGSVSNGLFLQATNTLGITTNATERLRVKSTGVFRYVTAFTVATLPTGASAEVGDIARVTDSLTPTVGSTVAAGGSAAALCWYNGTNWTVIGK